MIPHLHDSERGKQGATAEMNMPSLENQMQSSTAREPLGDPLRTRLPRKKESCTRESEVLQAGPRQLRVGSEYSL